MHTAICRMKESLGELEPCPGERCPFWEHDRCGLEQVDFRGRPELARFLTDLRGELESFRAAEDEGAARSHFFARLNAGLSE